MPEDFTAPMISSELPEVRKTFSKRSFTVTFNFSRFFFFFFFSYEFISRKRKKGFFNKRRCRRFLDLLCSAAR